MYIYDLINIKIHKTIHITIETIEILLDRIIFGNLFQLLAQA